MTTNGINGVPFHIGFEKDSILVVELSGNVTNKTALELEATIKDLLMRSPSVNKIVFAMEKTIYLSSRAISLLLKYQQNTDTIYFQIPQPVKDRIPDKKVLQKFQDKEINKDTLQELIEYLKESEKE